VLPGTGRPSGAVSKEPFEGGTKHQREKGATSRRVPSRLASAGSRASLGFFRGETGEKKWRGVYVR